MAKQPPPGPAGGDLEWMKVLELNELPEGRVMPKMCGHTTVCMTHHDGRLGALDNRCPHQGGPLGEGSIEQGLARCPWHGWDYDQLSGKAPGYTALHNPSFAAYARICAAQGAGQAQSGPGRRPQQSAGADGRCLVEIEANVLLK